MYLLFLCFLYSFLFRLQHQLEQQAEESYPAIQLAVRLPSYLRSVYELLEELALHLECDPGQLVLLGCTRTETTTQSAAKKGAIPAAGASAKGVSFEPAPSKGQSNYTIVFTVLSCPPNRVTSRRDYSYMHSFPLIMGTTTHRIVEKLLTATNLNTVFSNPVPTETDGKPAAHSATTQLLNYQPGSYFEEETGTCVFESLLFAVLFQYC